jgi:ATP-binding cassette subfamily F protein uup
MQYLSLENVTRSYGEKILFKNIQLSVNKGNKIALIAKNGSGKTTLLRVIAGEEGAEGENARIQFAKGIHISFLNQDPQFDHGATVMETIFDSDNPAIKAIRDYENALLSGNDEAIQKAAALMDDLKAWDKEASIKEILFRLKIQDLQQKTGTMSGGQRKRLALAGILIDDPDFLILDEPTNHLDIEMIEWLETFLQRPNLTLFMVTHDRYFLDNVCNEIIELDQGNIHVYRGNYAAYLEKKEARMLNQAANLEKTKKLYARELEWMRRQPQARTTKAKSRIDEFYEIESRAKSGTVQEDMQINIQASRLGSKILELHNISKNFGNKKILEPFSYKFKKGERVGIVGPNGSGKSTFLKLITQSLPPDTGKIVAGDTLVQGYYDQEGLVLNEDKTVLDVIRDIAEYIPMEKGQKLSAESLLERFLFPRSQQRVYVSQLSGGEKRRLYLLTILMKNPNFLILDEPTNDLDILTLNVLEDYLMDFPGCLIIVTHDRYFMDRLVDHIFVFEGNGKIKDFNGSYSEYRALQKSGEKSSGPTSDTGSDSPKKEASQNKIQFEQRKELQKLEKEIQKLENQKTEINLKFENPDLSPAEIMEWSEKLKLVQEQLDEKEMKWLEMSESI